MAAATNTRVGGRQRIIRGHVAARTRQHPIAELPLHAEYQRLTAIYVDGLGGGDRQEELGSRLSPSKWRTDFMVSFKRLEPLEKAMLK